MSKRADESRWAFWAALVQLLIIIIEKLWPKH
jgi:hypothetical protein